MGNSGFFYLSFPFPVGRADSIASFAEGGSYASAFSFVVFYGCASVFGGAAIINQKFTIVYNYMLETWGINLDDLREIVLRRQQEIPELDLSTIE